MQTIRHLTIIFIVLLVTGIALAQNSTDYTISDALQSQLNTIEQTTTDIRNLQRLDDVTLNFPTRDDLSEYLQTTLANELTDEVVANELIFYVGFGFLPQGYDLRENVLQLYEDQVAGFYDPETAEMNVILFSGERPDDRLPLLEQVIYSHEFVHALQDQHFDLMSFMENVDEDNVDALLARQALVEGDATAVMNAYTQIAAEANPIGALIEITTGALEAGNLTLPEGLPDILATELTWSYFTGESFVDALRESADGSWQPVNDAFANPPISTEQIYHPQKYLDNEMPIPVMLENEPPTTAWNMVREGTLGEFYLRQYLGQHLTPGAVATAATGWGGDTYMIYENNDGALAWEVALAWDTELDAAEFETAIPIFAGDAGQDEIITISPTVTCYANDAGVTLCLDTTGATESRISFAPTPDVAQALLGLD